MPINMKTCNMKKTNQLHLLDWGKGAGPRNVEALLPDLVYGSLTDLIGPSLVWNLLSDVPWGGGRNTLDLKA